MARAKIDKFGRTRYDADTDQGNLLFNTMDIVMAMYYRGCNRKDSRILCRRFDL